MSDQTTHHDTALLAVEAMFRDAVRLEEDSKTDRTAVRIWWARILGKLQRIFPDQSEIPDLWRSATPDWAGTRLQFFEKHLSADLNPHLYDRGDGLFNAYPDYQYAYDPFEEVNWLHHCLATMQGLLLDILCWVESGEQSGQLPPPRFGLPDLVFINDQGLRILCRARLQEAHQNYDRGAYFSAIVLLGSTLEGMLYSFADAQWNTASKAKSAPQTIKGGLLAKEKWTLDGLLKVGKELGWIQEEAGILGELLRDYRNLIHPVNHLKRNWTPNQAACHACFAAVYKAMDEMQSWLAHNSLTDLRSDSEK